MSSSPSPGGLDAGDIRILKFFKAVSCEGKSFLLFVFQKGCPKGNHETVEEYLKSKGLSNKDYKSLFDQRMRLEIEGDPSGKKFDVTLLFAVIQNACEKLAKKSSTGEWKAEGDELENYCVMIKNHRNEVAHGLKFPDEINLFKKLDTLQDHLEKGYKSARKRYDHIAETTVLDAVKKMRANIEKIKNATILPDLDIKKYQEEIKKLRDNLVNYVRNEGVAEVKDKIKAQTNVDPASFISGKQALKVKAVFTSLEVVKEKKGLKCEDQTRIDYSSVLEQKTDKDETPSIRVIEGEAGAGKSTFAKLIMADWAETSSSSSQIKDLDKYELVLYAECKNKFVTNFAHLLTLLMPQASYSMQSEDIERSVLALRVLLIFDGLDELNKASEQLVKEIVEDKMPKSTGMFHLLLTTRPQALKELPTLCSKFEWIHMRLLGIISENRPGFVQKLHEEMKNESMSTQDTQKLVDYVKRSDARLGEHFRLPLNLTLLTYLWAESPTDVNSVTTATHLFLRILKLIVNRLVSRIVENRHGERDKVYENVKIYLEVLYEMSFNEITSGSLQLSETSEQCLKNKCNSLELPFDDISAAFMNVTRDWTADGYELHLTAPHKSIMEFFAAKWILSRLRQPQNQSDIEKLKACLISLKIPETKKESMLESLKEENNTTLKSILKTESSLPKYQNVLLHVSGLLNEEGSEMLDQHAEELVDLLTQAETTGQQWLDIIAEAECNSNIANLIAPKIEKKLIVRDGHTGAAISIFKHLHEKTPVQVILNCEITYIPYLDNFLESLAKRNCSAEIHFKHQWRNMKCGNSDDLLKLFTDCSCQINKFTGNLNNLMDLPDSTESLKIAISNDNQAENLCSQMKDVVEEFSLEYLGIHVVKGVSPEKLRPLPIVRHCDKLTAALWLSGISDDDVDWAVRVAKVLLPVDGKFYSLMFPRSHLTYEGCRKLIDELRAHNIAFRHSSKMLVTTGISIPEVIKLRFYAANTLKCEFDCVDDAVIW